jgi:hypothetical protein
MGSMIIPILTTMSTKMTTTNTIMSMEIMTIHMSIPMKDMTTGILTPATL